MYRCTCVSGLCESSIRTPEPKPPRGIHYSKNEWKIANWAGVATVVSRIAQAHAGLPNFGTGGLVCHVGTVGT